MNKILVVAIFSVLLIAGMYQVKVQTDPWLVPVIAQGELNATTWINENTSPDDKFAADIFGGELIMGMTTRIPIVGGDWANAPDPAQNMADAERIFTTTSSSEAFEICRKYNCTYVFVPLKRQIHAGYGWKDVEADKFGDTDYFNLVYENQDVKIYRVIY